MVIIGLLVVRLVVMIGLRVVVLLVVRLVVVGFGVVVVVVVVDVVVVLVVVGGSVVVGFLFLFFFPACFFSRSFRFLSRSAAAAAFSALFMIYQSFSPNQNISVHPSLRSSGLWVIVAYDGENQNMSTFL